MKKVIFSLIVLVAAFQVSAQLTPVSWSFTAVKTADKTYEIHMKATIESGWHLYSQTQPDDAIAIPTGFTINKNALLLVDGKIKEDGKLENFHDEKLGISAHQYANSVDFVQVVKLKAKAKTNFTGKVEFQTCDDKKCLPPKTIPFSVAIQ